jgi:hypothetical protein
MSLTYQWAFDLDTIGAATVDVTDDGGSFTASVSTGTWCHTDIGTVEAGVASFAAALQNALNTASSSGAHTVTFSEATGYTLAYSGSTLELDFGTTTAAEGVRMRQILGMSGDRTGATSYGSQVRPFYFAIPAVGGRSNVTDEYEPTGVASEAVADDGSAYVISRDTAETWFDWEQRAEDEGQVASVAAFGEGTPVFARNATAAVPWSWQAAWLHMRAARHVLLVRDADGVDYIHDVRAEGLHFQPTRFAGTDIPIWSLNFRTRLLGTL